MSGYKTKQAVVLVVVLTALVLSASRVIISGPALGEEPRAVAKSAFPARILIIRHAEKPAKGEPSDDLSPEGFKRAEALPQLFGASAARSRPLAKPDFIFAAAKSKHSNRSVETVTPLAKKLALDIDSSYGDKEAVKLARELLTNRRYAGKTILICWHHGRIPELARALKATDAPDTWSNDDFNRVWQIEYDALGKASFRDLPQRLLQEDRLEKVGAR